LFELQARRVAGSVESGAARGARPRLLLSLELLGVGRLGRARVDLRVGVGCRADRYRNSEGRARSGHRSDATVVGAGGAGARARAHSALRKLEMGVARR